MTFRFTVNDHTLVCESVADAAALLGGILGAQPSRRAPHARASRPSASTGRAFDMNAARSWQPSERLRAFVGALAENERAALGLLATCGGELTLDELRGAAELSSTAEASTMISRLKRIAFEHVVDWSKLVSFRIAGARRDRTSIYSPGPLLTERDPGAA